ncbi:MAG: lipopolysaccharide biosynthesis protein [Saprospiraceae bacterium]|nr:lipopolysaccharide biosynthesis protein [Saprospiraceae bacterium]
MGIIKRQSIKNSLVSYLGVVIGAVSSIFIYTLIDKTELGMIQFAISTAAFFAPFASFASSMTATRFYPNFKTEDGKDNGFLSLLTLSTLTTTLIFVSLIYLFRLPIASFFQKDADQFLNSLHFILIFTILVAVATLFNSFAANQSRIVVPSLFQNLLPKVAQPTLVLLYFFGIIGFTQVFKGLALTFFLMMMGVVGYVYFLRPNSFVLPKNGSILRGYAAEMVRFSAFNFTIVLGSVFAQQADKIFITPMLGYESLAIFSFGAMIAEAIDVPRKALSGIAQPLIATSIAEKNWAHISEIYRKTALLQVIAGVFLLTGVWACADSLFDLMIKNGEAYRTGKWVILILGLSRLADMATGTNAEIITFSEYYRFNFRSFATMAVMNIVLNLLLIPIWGIEGSALATLLAIAIVNVWRLVFIKQKFNMQPLDRRMLWVFTFGFLAWLAAYTTPSVYFADLPKMVNAMLTIFLKGSIVAVVYLFLILRFNVSTDVSQTVNQFWGSIKKRKP